jgi:hypothetical protein
MVPYSKFGRLGQSYEIFDSARFWLTLEPEEDLRIIQ